MSFLFGFGIGVLLGMVFAPAPGKRTRAQVAKKARELTHLPQRTLQESVDKIAARTEAEAGEIGSRVGREVAEATVKQVKDEVLGKTNRPA